jgi:hypothetical protein
MRDEAPAIAATVSVLDMIAEIGRLRADNERWQRYGAHRYWEGRWRDEKAENDKLRAVLKEIVTTDPPATSSDWFAEWKGLVFRLKGIARRELEREGSQ